MNKLKAQIKAFWESPLDEEEQWYENHSDEFKPVDKQAEMRKEMIEAANKLSPPLLRTPPLAAPSQLGIVCNA